MEHACWFHCLQDQSVGIAIAGATQRLGDGCKMTLNAGEAYLGGWWQSVRVLSMSCQDPCHLHNTTYVTRHMECALPCISVAADFSQLDVYVSCDCPCPVMAAILNTFHSPCARPICTEHANSSGGQRQQDCIQPNTQPSTPASMPARKGAGRAAVTKLVRLQQ